MTALHVLWKVITLKEVNALETAEQATQTDRDPLVDDLNELLYKNIRLKEMLTETENRLADTDEAYTNIQTILRDYNHDRRRTIIEAGQQEIYFTAEDRGRLQAEFGSGVFANFNFSFFSPVWIVCHTIECGT